MDWTLTQRAEHHCMTVCDPDQNTLASLRVRCVVNKTESPQYSQKCSCCMQDLICWLIRSNHFATLNWYYGEKDVRQTERCTFFIYYIL